MNEWGLILGGIVAGGIASFHCVGMCAPLSCSLMRSDSGQNHGLFLVHYHIGRLVSYAVIGALAGFLGATFFEGVSIRSFQVAAWFLVIVYFSIAWGWELKTRPGSLGFRISQRLYPWVMRFKNRSGFSLGMLTPLLPCTPLYLSASVAFLSGKAFLGMGIMGGFVVGTLPVYVTSQVLWIRMQLLGNPRSRLWVRRSLALFAATLLIWRLSTGEFMASGTQSHGSGFPCFQGNSGESAKSNRLILPQSP